MHTTPFFRNKYEHQPGPNHSAGGVGDRRKWTKGSIPRGINYGHHQIPPEPRKPQTETDKHSQKGDQETHQDYRRTT